MSRLRLQVYALKSALNPAAAHDAGILPALWSNTSPTPDAKGVNHTSPGPHRPGSRDTRHLPCRPVACLIDMADPAGWRQTNESRFQRSEPFRGHVVLNDCSLRQNSDRSRPLQGLVSSMGDRASQGAATGLMAGCTFGARVSRKMSREGVCSLSWTICRIHANGARTHQRRATPW